MAPEKRRLARTAATELVEPWLVQALEVHYRRNEELAAAEERGEEGQTGDQRYQVHDTNLEDMMNLGNEAEANRPDGWEEKRG